MGRSGRRQAAEGERSPISGSLVQTDLPLPDPIPAAFPGGQTGNLPRAPLCRSWGHVAPRAGPSYSLPGKALGTADFVSDGVITCSELNDQRVEPGDHLE